jgi:hypothetical protein
MNPVLYNVLTELRHAQAFVHDLHINPWAAAILAGVIAAFMEQRRIARRTAAFNTDHVGAIAGKPR